MGEATRWSCQAPDPGGRMMPDLHDRPLESVFDPDDSPLGNAVRRLLEDIGRRGETYAAHGSTP